MGVSFDRDEHREYGVNIVEGTLDDYRVQFVPLDLPRLIRRRIKTGEEMVASDRDHIVYEVVGSVDELAKVESSVLLDKKIAHRAEKESVLDLTGLSLAQEVETYLQHQRVEDVDGIVQTWKGLGIT
jgi:hypothetical protein